MKKREWFAMIVLAMITMAALLVGIEQIYVTGVDGPRLRSKEAYWQD